MALITCPSCKKPVSAESSTCPGCSHTLREIPGKKSKKGCLGLSGGCLAVILILFVIGGCILAASKPTESAMRSEVCTKLGGAVCAAGSIIEGLGFVTISYHDYILFSTLTIKAGSEPEKTIAFGIFGQTITNDSRKKPERTRPGP